MAAGFGFMLFSGFAVLSIAVQQGGWGGSSFVGLLPSPLVLWGGAILCSVVGLFAFLIMAGGLLSLYYDAKGLTG